MCFSPEMDIGAGVVVGSIGLAALRHVDRPQELPLASLPVLFGAHQLTEAFVWWGLRDDVAASTGHAALWLYVLFAFVVLPILAPVAVLLVEPDTRRRRLVGRYAVLGALVSLVYLVSVVRQPPTVTIQGHTLGYGTGAPHGDLLAVLYAGATVGALLNSSHRRIALFGAANFVVAPLLLLLSARAFTSLWCLWAAVASVVIADHLQHTLGGSVRDGAPGSYPPVVGSSPGEGSS
jgi:uncharacterized protein DUF6629